jgi:hypothetical protein
MALAVPVVFLVFNRPACTARTFAEIRKAQPRQLLVVADGPRQGHLSDAASCLETRRIVDDGVDWPCEVLRNYSERNLGCAERVASGLTWAFSVVESAIVLEDDCLPDPSFFPYCEELLVKYRDDARVGQICGTPLITPSLERDASYVFSRYGPIWGWASWRRAWAYYDLKLQNWPQLRATRGLSSVIHSPAELRWRIKLYDSLHSGPRETWDYQWGYAKISQSMLSVIPCQNLIENIGFGEGATHTRGKQTGGLPLGALPMPLRHPQWVLPDADFEKRYSQSCVRGQLGNRLRSLWAKMAGILAPSTRLSA